MNVTGSITRIFAAGLVAGCMLSMSMSLTGCMTDDKGSTPPANQHTPWGPDTTVSIGAQGNLSLGSAIDLDTRTVMPASVALQNQGTIDLVFIFSDGDLKLASPVAAKAAGDVPLAAQYDATKIHDTQFAFVSSKPDDSQQADTAYAGYPKFDVSIAIEGGQYLVKTDKGKIAILTVHDIQGIDNTASAKLTIALSGL